MTCIPIKDGIICTCKTDFECPRCGYEYQESDYMQRLENSHNGFIYKTCKGCKEKLGISSNIRGDVVVWLKSEETKIAK